MGALQKKPLLGVRTIRIILYCGLFWGSLIFGNSPLVNDHSRTRRVPKPCKIVLHTCHRIQSSKNLYLRCQRGWCTSQLLKQPRPTPTTPGTTSSAYNHLIQERLMNVKLSALNCTKNNLNPKVRRIRLHGLQSISAARLKSTEPHHEER